MSEILTKYGICPNVNIKTIMPYTEDCFIFKNQIINPETPKDGYLLFGFEVWKEDNSFHFFVEKGNPDGTCEFVNAELSNQDIIKVKKIYELYCQMQEKNRRVELDSNKENVLYNVIAYDKDNDITVSIYKSTDLNQAIEIANHYKKLIENDLLVNKNYNNEPFDFIQIEDDSDYTKVFWTMDREFKEDYDYERN